MGLDQGPWLMPLAISIVKFMVLFVVLLQLPPILIWLERRAPALMQRRRGPNRVGLFKWRLWGLLQTLADAIKLIFKEESVPASAHKLLFQLAPVLGLIPALLVMASIPLGPDLLIAGQRISLNIVRLNIGFLFILAISSIAVYSVTLSGWASNNKFALLGSMRASAQMISYEISLGLSLVPMVLIYGSFDLYDIVNGQVQLWAWGIFLAPLSFVLFLICMFAETNRAPFDLAEGESELVAGFHVEFGSTKFALFYLSEYINMFALSLLCAIFFFGGWQIPFVSHEQLQQLLASQNLASLCGLAVLLIKAAFFMWLYIWVRWTIPRFRYDQLMTLGWKFMLPLGLVNVMVTALVLTTRF